MHKLVQATQSRAIAPLFALYHRLCPRLVITRKLFDVRCRINVNDHLMWLFLPQDQAVETACYRIMNQEWGRVWDVGANFGFYSLVAAKSGNEVTAFDLSEYVLTLLSQSCKLNDVTVATVPRGMTVKPVHYTPPSDAHCRNRLQPDEGGTTSMTYLEAEDAFGIPRLIKMDIEGGEKEFFESPDFMAWLREKRISLLVELHGGYRPPLDAIDWARHEMADNSHLFIDTR